MKKVRPTRTPKAAPDPTVERVRDQLKELRLPTMRAHFEAQATRATTEGHSYAQYLGELTSQECATRAQGRIQRLMRHAHLPAGKTWSAFEWSRVPVHVMRQCQSLRDTRLDLQDLLVMREARQELSPLPG